MTKQLILPAGSGLTWNDDNAGAAETYSTDWTTYDFTFSTAFNTSLIFIANGGQTADDPGLTSLVRDPGGADEAFTKLIETTASDGGRRANSSIWLLDKKLATDTVRVTAPNTNTRLAGYAISLDRLQSTTPTNTSGNEASGGGTSITLPDLNNADDAGALTLICGCSAVEAITLNNFGNGTELDNQDIGTIAFTFAIGYGYDEGSGIVGVSIGVANSLCISGLHMF